METDRRFFLRAAGSSMVLGAGSVWSASAAQTPAPPVSFPGIANPLDSGPGRYLYVSNDTQVVRGRIRADFPGGSPIRY